MAHTVAIDWDVIFVDDTPAITGKELMHPVTGESYLTVEVNQMWVIVSWWKQAQMGRRLVRAKQIPTRKIKGIWHTPRYKFTDNEIQAGEK